MTGHRKVRDFIVGLDYESIEEDKGHITIRRKVSLVELIEELRALMTIGSIFPQFPPEAHPTVTYAWDLNNQEDGDCYHEIMEALEDKKEVKTNDY